MKRSQLGALATLSLFCATSAANPTGAAVANGSASFAASGATLTVTNSPGTVINWQGFNIAPGEATRFVQQNGASAVLNRVMGANASSILGALTSNGRIFIVNPNGILFGATSQINAAGLVASTVDIGNAAFAAGNLVFAPPAPAGPITVHGNITAHDFVTLNAPAVNIGGTVTVQNGPITINTAGTNSGAAVPTSIALPANVLLLTPAIATLNVTLPRQTVLSTADLARASTSISARVRAGPPPAASLPTPVSVAGTIVLAAGASAGTLARPPAPVVATGASGAGRLIFAPPPPPGAGTPPPSAPPVVALNLEKRDASF